MVILGLSSILVLEELFGKGIFKKVLRCLQGKKTGQIKI